MAFKRNADKIKQAMAESAESVVEQSTPVETAEKTATECKKPVPRRRRSIGDVTQAQNIRVWRETHAKINFIAKTLLNRKIYEVVDEMVDYFVAHKLTGEQKETFNQLFKK